MNEHKELLLSTLYRAVVAAEQYLDNPNVSERYKKEVLKEVREALEAFDDQVIG